MENLEQLSLKSAPILPNCRVLRLFINRTNVTCVRYFIFLISISNNVDCVLNVCETVVPFTTVQRIAPGLIHGCELKQRRVCQDLMLQSCSQDFTLGTQLLLCIFQGKKVKLEPGCCVHRLWYNYNNALNWYFIDFIFNS